MADLFDSGVMALSSTGSFLGTASNTVLGDGKGHTSFSTDLAFAAQQKAIPALGGILAGIFIHNRRIASHCKERGLTNPTQVGDFKSYFVF